MTLIQHLNEKASSIVWYLVFGIDLNSIHSNAISLKVLPMGFFLSFLASAGLMPSRREALNSSRLDLASFNERAGYPPMPLN